MGAGGGSALTLSGTPLTPAAGAAGATGATTGVSPASSRLSSGDARTAVISPTWPAPAGGGSAVSGPPATPDKPIAWSPTARSAATTGRLAGPASTISTTSATPGGVTRRPSRFSTGRPRRRDSALTAWPPPCTTTRGSSGLRASAQAASHSGRSSSFPPNLTTRTLSMIPTLKGWLGTTPSLRTAHCRAQASAWESRAAELPSLRRSAYEPQGLGEPEHDVEVLHGLPRRSLHQVVDRRDHREARPTHVLNGGDAQRHAIPVHHVFEGGQGAARSEERRVWKECRSRWSPYH